jgi:hypothetical protein
MQPEQACIALRAHEHREAFFPLDADFALRVTLQQPKLLCSSHLGETCQPYSRCRAPQAFKDAGWRQDFGSEQ